MIPKSRDSFFVFDQRDRKTLGFVVDLHEHEWVVVDVTIQLDIRFHSPVILQTKLIGKRVLKKEATLKSTHVAI